MITTTRTNFKLPEFAFKYAYYTCEKKPKRVIEERSIGGRNLKDAKKNLLNILYRSESEVHFIEAYAL